MTEEKKLNIGTVPEGQATQISDGQFEPEKGEFLLYFKFVAMTKNAIRNNNHKIENIFGPEKGGLVFGDPEDMRIYLHKMVDIVVNAGKEAAKNSP